MDLHIPIPGDPWTWGFVEGCGIGVIATVLIVIAIWLRANLTS